MNTTPQNNTAIAIIGMAGRFPKAQNIDEFWQNLCEGVEGISFFTDEELAAAGTTDGSKNPGYVKARGMLEGADLFDAAFFGINPREAETMDPQHRIFLECAWEALENAGCDPEKFDGAIGVFAGASMNTYLARNLLTRPDITSRLNEHQLMLANDKDFLPTRVSYKLNLRGPSLNIQTACSTSLVAVCVACQNLLNYECDVALAGAVSLTFPQKRGYLFQEGGIASPDGHCRAFDAKAAGTVAGEGAGIVVLKRLEEAMADGDTVYAVIRGFAINNDGANKIGYTAPSVEGQAEVIATAQAMAGFPPESIGYIEAHGTGTPLGDPIEIEGLTKAFHAGTAKKNFCALGSVKSSVGHLDTAAGVTGLIKTALALHHKKIPASLHFHSPNPKIDFANSPFFVNAKLTEWKNENVPRRAGVSSFGIGGTNAHVVLEEASKVESPVKSRAAQLLLLSAKTETALEAATAHLAAHLKQHPGLDLADVACTLQIGRREFPHRRMLVCHDATEAGEILTVRNPKQIFTRATEAADRPVVFMFPGQGAQQSDMARELYEHEAVFREQLDFCCETLRPHLGFDLRTVLYPDSGKTEEAQNQLRQTAITQPALFAIEYALAKLWMSRGIQPQAMIGHSIGEYVAACLAGVFSPEDALKLVALRGRMMQQLPGGTMLAVRLREDEITPLLDKQVSLAAVNAPSLCVVSGQPDRIDIFQRTLTERGIACTPLQTSHAFHSVMMEPVLQPFAEAVGKMQLHEPEIPFISNVTGGWISKEEATDSRYWAKHLRHTVRFADGIAELFKDPARILLEVGPGQTLSNLAKQHPARGADNLVVSSLRQVKDTTPDLDVFLNALGQLWLSGTKIDWQNFYRHEPHRRVPLPSYPFERKRYFIEPAKSIREQAVSSPDAPGTEREEIVPIRHAIAPTAKAGETEALQMLRAMLCDLSGLNPAAINSMSSFTEMGFESLFLTQFSVAIEKKTGVRVAFRQLLGEFSTLEALAEHVEKNGKPKSNHENDHTPASKPLRGDTFDIPLTEAQREVWFASQMSDKASCAYNECRLLHLRGALKENTLASAIQTLLDRHEALRTTFPGTGEFQRIHRVLKVDAPLLDWSKLPADGRTSRLGALQIEEAGLPFDLTAGPMLRAWLIRMDEQHHVLVLTVHHIVCDGYSLGLLLRELAEIYSAECKGIRREPAAPLQMSEYVRRQSLEDAARAADEKFWLEQFTDDVPLLELPTDRARSPVWTFAAAHESCVLPATLGTGSRRLGAQQGGTLFTTLLTAFGTLLHRLSGQNEVVVGIPIAARAMDGGETLVGHCVNFLPLRLRADEGVTFAGSMAGVQKLFLDAHEHQHCTFGRLLQRLNLSRDAGRMPLVSVTFNVQQLGETLTFHGLKTRLDPNVHSFTNFDLGFNVTEINGALQLDCRYNKSLFDAGTIQRWLGHFRTLLESATADPQQRIFEIALLTPAERQKLLAGHDASIGSFPDKKCIHQLFEEQARKTPGNIAISLDGRQTSYAELDQCANRLAHHLCKLGVGPEVMVGICLDRSVEMVVSILAVLKSGGAYVPMEPAWPEERIAFVMQDTGAPVLLTQKTRSDQFKSADLSFQLVCVDETLDEQKSGHDAPPKIEAGPENLAYVIYTSGSTGQPKGVMVTHRNVTRLFHATQAWYQFNEQDVWTLFHSYAFDFSVWETWGALLYGGRLVIVPHQTSRSPDMFLDLLVRERVTVLNQTPSAFRQLIQAEKRLKDSIELALRLVIFGGEALEMQSLQPWFARHGDQHPLLVNMYGITETTVHVTYRPIGLKDLEAGSVIGRPILDLGVYILDAHRQPVPIGVPGEMYVGGAGVARGYLNRPELTAEKFIPDQFTDKKDARLYRTGDLARWRADGDIEYLGRADDQVKIRGHRIELGEIESALLRHPAVRECTVLAREDSPGDKRLTGYIVTEPDKASVTFGELRDFLRTKLPDYMLPSALIFLDALPLTPNGKVNRKMLPKPEQARPDLSETFAPPGTPTETALVSIWREVLRVQNIGIHDNFFELGGHSLLMTQVISRLRDAFQVELPIRCFFESPTVAGLSIAIEELLADEISRLSDEEARRLTQSTA